MESNINKQLNSEEIKKFEEDLYNKIYEEKNYLFQFYSTNDLKSLSSFSNYNIEKIMFYLENYTRDENLKKIQEYLLSSNLNQIKKVKNIKKITNENFYIINKFFNTKEEFDSSNFKQNNINQILEKPWLFIYNGINIINIQDALLSFDKAKIFAKIKKEIGQSNSKSKGNLDNIINLLTKKLELKEKKILNLYKNNLEDYDIEYLKNREDFIEFEKNIKHPIIKETDKKVIDYLYKFSTNLRNIIFSYIDIFTLGKLGLTCKNFYNFVFKQYNLNNDSAKIYINSIFINSKLYELNTKLIKQNYKNNLDLFIKKPRIRFGGVYYCRLKTIKEFQYYGEETHNNSIIFYRFLRFLPNGDVFTMTTPFFKNHKIKQGLKNGVIELKKGKYKIKENDTVNIINDNNDEYIYKIGWTDWSKYRLGYGLNDDGVNKGIELLNYYMINKSGERIEIPLNENFPRRFRFRVLNHLKNELFIKKNIEIKFEEI